MSHRLHQAPLLLVLAAAGFVPASAVFVSACAVPISPVQGTGGQGYGQCQSTSECGLPGECSSWVCEQHQCVAQNTPAGAMPANPSVTAPCHRIVCDGNGGETDEVDPTSQPPQDSVAPCQRAICDASGNIVTMPDATHVPPDTSPGDCQRPSCDANGNPTLVPDPTDVPTDVPGDCQTPACTATGTPTFMPNPTDLPPDVKGDCKAPACTASGMPSFTPDPKDVPADTPGDCKAPACDTAGNVTSVPANDPPPPTTCMAFTCSNGMAVGMPANPTASCSPEGFICGTDGMCNTCPMADAQCTDPGPGAAAHSLATEHDFGTIGWCDQDGFGVCGSLQKGVTSYFGYTANGGVTFCDFNPFVQVQAPAPVTLCEYFACPSVTCPLPSLPATLNGQPGCCVTGASSTMAITPSCEDSHVYITVSSQNATCTSYAMNFHS